MNEIIVQTKTPNLLDNILQTYFNAVLEEESEGVYRLTEDGFYTVRCYGNNRDYVVFALQHQGYAKVMRLQ